MDESQTKQKMGCRYAFYVVLLLVVLGISSAFVVALLGSSGVGGIVIGVGIWWLIFALGIWLLIVRPIRKRQRAPKVTVPATVVRIDKTSHPGGGTTTAVIFDSRGKRIRVHLADRLLASNLLNELGPGDTGMLTYLDNTMYDWQPPTLESPSVDARHLGVFVSYAHEWTEDATYVAQSFETAGLNVWFDKSQVRIGDRLTAKIEQAIRQSTYFVPLLSQDYWNSQWCIQEFELAAEAGINFMPIKVSPGELVMPPHIRTLYTEQLGEPVYLDLRGHNPVAQLRELARQMTTEAMVAT